MRKTNMEKNFKEKLKMAFNMVEKGKITVDDAITLLSETMDERSTKISFYCLVEEILDKSGIDFIKLSQGLKTLKELDLWHGETLSATELVSKARVLIINSIDGFLTQYQKGIRFNDCKYQCTSSCFEVCIYGNDDDVVVKLKIILDEYSATEDIAVIKEF